MPILSVITDEISADLDHALDVCDELGVGTVELRTIGGRNIVELDDTAIAGVRDSLDRHGARVVCIASPFLKCDVWDDAAAHETQLGILRRSLDLAAALGAPIVRTFTFWRAAEPTSLQAAALAALEEATAICRDTGVLLGLENEHACTAATGEEAAWYLDRIPDRTLGAIWDPGNEAVVGSDPCPGGYEAVRGRIHHIHLKDPSAVARDPTFVVMGEGAIDYVAQFRALAADGYDGALSLETHMGRSDAEREAASRESIAGIRRIAEVAGLGPT